MVNTCDKLFNNREGRIGEDRVSLILQFKVIVVEVTATTVGRQNQTSMLGSMRLRISSINHGLIKTAAIPFETKLK